VRREFAPPRALREGRAGIAAGGEAQSPGQAALLWPKASVLNANQFEARREVAKDRSDSSRPRSEQLERWQRQREQRNDEAARRGERIGGRSRASWLAL
jgi:hypothetical protein